MVRKNKLYSQTLSGSPQSQFTDFSSKAVVADRAPTTADIGYDLGQEWIHRGNSAYILIQVAAGLATWEATGGSITALATLTGNTGLATPIASNINVIGTTADGLSFVGSAGQLLGSISAASNTQRGTLETATTFEVIDMVSSTVAVTPNHLPIIMTTRYIVGDSLEAPFGSIQEAIDFAQADVGEQNIVYVRPGVYTENLVFTTGTVSIVALNDEGQNDFVEIVGVHTPPATGHVSLNGFYLTSTTDIFSSAASGSANLSLINCTVNLTNGHTFDVANWTGSILLQNCKDVSTINGIINNTTGSSVIRLLNSEAGKTATNVMFTRSTLTIDDCRINAPITFQTGTSFTITNSTFTHNLNAANNSTGTIDRCFFNMGAIEAFSQSSSGTVNLTNCMISSSADPCIAGPGSGTLNISGISFLDNYEIASSVNLNTAILRGGNFISQFVVAQNAFDEPDATFRTIQSALDEADDMGGGIVYVKSGGYTENLTLYDNTQVIGIGNNDDVGAPVTITGVHTPPDSGEFIFENLALNSSTHIFSSESAGTASLKVKNCIINCMSGFTYNLPNWTGTLMSEGCYQAGNDNGEINNTTGSSIILYEDTEFGVGTGQTAVIPGDFTFDNVLFRCPVDLEGSAEGKFFGGCHSTRLIRCLDSTDVNIYGMSFATGAASSLYIDSDLSVYISDVTIDSSATDAIDGTVDGNLFLGSVTFLDSTGIDANIGITTTTLQHRVSDSYIGGGQFVNRTAVNSSPYTVLNTDFFISVDCSGGAITVRLPNPTSGNTNKFWVVKDRTGSANTNNISVTTVTGAANIDGATTYTMNQNYASFAFLSNGTTYEVF